VHLLNYIQNQIENKTAFDEKIIFFLVYKSAAISNEKILNSYPKLANNRTVKKRHHRY
jgi:hypothetical protein